MRALVMTSVVLRRVRNRLRIIIIIIISCPSNMASYSVGLPTANRGQIRAPEDATFEYFPLSLIKCVLTG